MKAFFLAVCFCSLILCAPRAVLCADETSPAPASATQDAQDMELDSIKSRLMTDMFFAGELADAIMEIGVQNRLIPLSGGEDRAQNRAKLILWIRSHPDSAAEI